MINPQIFVKLLKKRDIAFISGVPDSLLKSLCACISEEYSDNSHIIATNEGSAIALGIGYHLGSNKVPMIYMQNSGIGNIINPITSLADKKVYGIPMLLVIGWRGEILSDGSQLKDEPQHKKQGLITINQLNLLGITCEIIDKDTKNLDFLIDKLLNEAKSKNTPVALVVRKNTFSKYEFSPKIKDNGYLSRELIIEEIISNSGNCKVITTTGMASRELYEIREKNKNSHEKDFLTVGGMGHASQIAAGLAISQPNKKVICIDGDGALLMHTGGLSISGKLDNLIHIVINNGVHDSVGGQPTMAEFLCLSEIARNFKYSSSITVSSKEELNASLKASLISNKSTFIEVLSKPGSRQNLGRPLTTPIQNKNAFLSSNLND